MAGGNKRRGARLGKTKAEPVGEPKSLERRLSVLEGGQSPAVILDGIDDAIFKAVIANSPTAIFVRDPKSRYVLVNDVYEKLFMVDGRSAVCDDVRGSNGSSERHSAVEGRWSGLHRRGSGHSPVDWRSEATTRAELGAFDPVHARR